MTRSYKSRHRKGILFFLRWPLCSFVRGIESMPKHPQKDETTHGPPRRTNGTERHQFLVLTAVDGLEYVSKQTCWQYCIGKVVVMIILYAPLLEDNTWWREMCEGQKTGVHSVPGKTGILLLAPQRKIQSPAVFDSRSHDTFRRYSTLVLLQSTTHRSGRIFLGSSTQSKAVRRKNREMHTKYNIRDIQ